MTLEISGLLVVVKRILVPEGSRPDTIESNRFKMKTSTSKYRRGHDTRINDD